MAGQNYRYISFNPQRTIGIPMVRYLKPENMFSHIEDLDGAAAVLFPESWQVNALAYGLKSNLFPSVSTYHLGYDKVEMTRGLLSVVPMSVPKTIIGSNQIVCFDSVIESLGQPFVCKEIRSSSGFGVFLIHTREDFESYTKTNTVIYAQQYLTFDRDLRVVVIGDRIFDAYWRVKNNGFHCNIARGATVDRHDISPEVLDHVLAVARALNINYAGFDVVVMPEGIYLLEFNMLFGTKGLNVGATVIGRHIHNYLEKQIQQHPAWATSWKGYTRTDAPLK